MRATEAKLFSNISATTSSFQLQGGVYVLEAVATWGGGSVSLQRLGPDGSTYFTVITALTDNGLSAGTALPGGTYRVAVTTATAVYASVTRIPGE